MPGHESSQKEAGSGYNHINFIQRLTSLEVKLEGLSHDIERMERIMGELSDKLDCLNEKKVLDLSERVGKLESTIGLAKTALIVAFSGLGVIFGFLQLVKTIVKGG